MPQILRKLDNQDAGIFVSQIDGDLERIVGTAVVNKNHFIVGIKCVQLRQNSTIEFLDIGSRMKQRGDNANHHLWSPGPGRSARIVSKYLRYSLRGCSL